MSQIPAFETITYDEGDDGVATVTLNRPDVHNAFNSLMQRVGQTRRVEVEMTSHAAVSAAQRSELAGAASARGRSFAARSECDPASSVEWKLR